MIRYENILVGVDFRRVGEADEELLTTDSEEAVARAILLGKEAEAQLTFAHTLPDDDRVREHVEAAGDAHGSVLAAVEQAMRKLVARAEAKGVRAQWRLLFGAPAKAVEACAEAGPFDLVVIGTRQQHGFRRALFGSTAQRVMMRCAVPVLVTHHQPLQPFARVVIATDATAHESGVLRHGLAMGHLNHSQVEVVHGVENWFEGRWHRAGLARETIEREHEDKKREARERLEAMVAKIVAELGVEAPKVTVETGQPAQVIWQAATGRPTDLVVMGVAGRSGFERLRDVNTAERILPELPCSLLTVHLDPEAADS